MEGGCCNLFMHGVCAIHLGQFKIFTPAFPYLGTLRELRELRHTEAVWEDSDEATGELKKRTGDLVLAGTAGSTFCRPRRSNRK